MRWLKKQLTGHEKFPLWLKLMPSWMLLTAIVRVGIVYDAAGWLLALSEVLLWIIVIGSVMKICLERHTTRVSPLEVSLILVDPAASEQQIREARRVSSGDVVYIPPNCENCCDTLPLWQCFLLGCGAMC